MGGLYGIAMEQGAEQSINQRGVPRSRRSNALRIDGKGLAASVSLVAVRAPHALRTYDNTFPLLGVISVE